MRKELLIGAILVVCLAVPVLFFQIGARAQSGLDVENCKGCHEKLFKDIKVGQGGSMFLKHPSAPSEPLVCESCHGSLTEHADSNGGKFTGLIRFAKDPAAVKTRNETCLSCHAKRARMSWVGSTHEMRDLACADCHNPHKSGAGTKFLLKSDTVIDTCNRCHKSQVANQMRFSHHPLREGKMTCTSCHQPHGSFADKLLRANTINEQCWSCHPKYRGPFIHEHPPVRENCANCHIPHGSNYPRLLKEPQLRLCRECHNSLEHGINFSAGQRVNRTVGRLCTECHINIHGTNHPQGDAIFFLR